MAVMFLISAVFTVGCGQMTHKHKAPESTQQPGAIVNDPSQTPAQTPVQTPVQAPTQIPSQVPPPAQPVVVATTTVVVTPAVSPVPANGNLFVVVGGNGTCLSRRMSSTVDGLISSEIFELFNENFLLNGLVTPADDVIYACYEWQSADLQFYDLRLRAPMAPLHETQLLDVVLSRASTFRQVVVIGHSAGGWLAMKVAASPALAAMPVKITLVTIDPVSRINCQRLRDDGCREAPTDFSPMEMAQLDIRTEWFNAWQRPGILLGSAPIPPADVNVEFNSTHPRIVKEPAVWAAISQFLTGQL
jgi:hypothetical protein